MSVYQTIFDSFHLTQYTQQRNDLAPPPSAMTDHSMQREELDVLDSIYGSEWICDGTDARSYQMTLQEAGHEVILYIKLPHDYPSTSPPSIELSAPSLSRQQKQTITFMLDDVYLSLLGEPVIYQWVEKVREFLFTLKPESVPEQSNWNQEVDDNIKKVPSITHGEVFTDRKSRFQAHVCRINSKEDVANVIDYLKVNKSISNATHNVWAYRVKKGTTTHVEDFDDDGESAAGKRLLHMLHVMGVENVLLIVTRWYGGIHLGADRFRHYNNVGRQLLLSSGLL